MISQRQMKTWVSLLNFCPGEKVIGDASSFAPIPHKHKPEWRKEERIQQKQWMANRASLDALPFYFSENQICKILGNQKNGRRYSGLKPLPFLNTSMSDNPIYGPSPDCKRVIHSERWSLRTYIRPVCGSMCFRASMKHSRTPS